MTGRSLAEFAQKHDPRALADVLEQRWDQPTPKNCKAFIVVCAQNATPLHAEFWTILKKIAEHRKAQLLVIPIRYKNPTSAWVGSQQNAEWWDVPQEYLQNVRKQLNPNLVVLADVKTQPTANDPLTKFDAMSGGFSAILGHTKLALKCIPTTGGKLPRILTTTGTCTVPNYSDTKAGKVGEFHHSLSAVLVELDGPLFHLRQLHYHSGSKSVTDGVRGDMYRFEPNGDKPAVTRWPAPRPLALVEGDKHVDFMCPIVEKATKRLLGELDPEHTVLHDVLDAYSCNPHHWGNPMNAIAKFKSGMGDVAAEVQRAIRFIRDRAKTRKVVVVASNHDNMLARWILAADWKKDPENASFYLRTAAAMAADCRLTRRGTEYVDPFLHWLDQSDTTNVIPVGGRLSFILAGVELGLHGDKGANGARGSTRNLRRIGVKVIKGHDHTAAIDEGAYGAGTSSILDPEYIGPVSSWTQSHVLLQWDGKRQIVFIIKGRYRAE